jgi:hypothetical protein
MDKELWLEYGHEMKDGFHDMLWYNEGNANEWPHFAKALVRRVLKHKPTYKTYFKARYGRRTFEVAL